MHPAPSSSAALPALFTKSAGMLISVSPLAAWMKWQTLPSAALLAPLAVIGLLACAALFCKRLHAACWSPSFRPSASRWGRPWPSRPFAWPPRIFSSSFPRRWRPWKTSAHFPRPLIQGNLLVHLASLALLTLAAAYSCMLCLGKRGKNA